MNVKINCILKENCIYEVQSHPSYLLYVPGKGYCKFFLVLEKIAGVD